MNKYQQELLEAAEAMIDKCLAFSRASGLENVDNTLKDSLAAQAAFKAILARAIDSKLCTCYCTAETQDKYSPGNLQRALQLACDQTIKILRIGNPARY